MAGNGNAGPERLEKGQRTVIFGTVGRARLLGLRLDHGPQRQLLQVPQLRLKKRM